MPSGTRLLESVLPDFVEPIQGFRFDVDIISAKVITGAPIRLGFQKVSGFGANVGVYEWEEISDPVTVWKMPDTIKFDDLTLSRGVTHDGHGLWKWYAAVVEALSTGITVQIRSDIEIRAYGKGEVNSFGVSDTEGNSAVSRTWRVFDAFPKSVKYAELNAQKSLVHIESLVLAHEGFKLQV